MGPDLARPGVLLVHCAGTMGLGFGIVVTSDRERSRGRSHRVTCCVIITRARGRPGPGLQGSRLPRHLGPARVGDDALSAPWLRYPREGRPPAPYV